MNLFIQYGLLLAAPALTQAQNLTILPPNPPASVHRDVRPKVAKFNFQIQAVDLTKYSIGEPTDEEQLYLELINRARANPTAEGLRLATSTDPDVQSALKQFNVDLDVLKTEFAALEPRPPLAMNKKLSDAARKHTEFLFETATQTHTGRDESTIDERIAAEGYNWSSVSENVYSYARDTFYSHDGFQVDWGDGPGATYGMQAGRGHRVAIHDETPEAGIDPDVGINREVGIAVKLGTKTVGSNIPVGPHLVTQDFATDSSADGYGTPFVTGVAYYDLNANNFYDLGEGIGGLTVNVEGASSYAVTSASGGYAVPVPSTAIVRAVTFTGLGANTASNTAVASDEANVKMDFKPAFIPASLSGSDAIQIGQTSNYTFNPVLGATGYKGRVVRDVNATADSADNPARMTVNQSGVYPTSVKFEGNGSYHLVCPQVGPQTLTYKNSFHVKTGATLSFDSRLGRAAADQVARVEVSTNNGLSWQSIYRQAGEGENDNGETSFRDRSISLETFAGKTIQLRFNFSINSGSFFDQTTVEYGWYIDDITFGNLIDTSSASITTLPEGTTFAFTPSVAGPHLLAVSPIISGRDLGFGSTKIISVSSGPPSLAEIDVEEPAGSGLTDGGSTVQFGSQFRAQSEIRTFTVRNSGTEDLTGLSLSVSGTHAVEFVAGNLGAISLAPTASTTFTVTFTPSALGARSAVLSIASNDESENPFEISLAGTGTNTPRIDVPPLALIRREGALATLAVTASHPTLPLTYAWKKNGVIVKSAVSSSLSFNAVKLTDAGSYSVVVSIPGESIETPPVVLAVIKPMAQNFVQLAGTTIKPAVSVSGAATLTWKKISGTPPVIETLTNPTPLTLVLANLNAGNSSALYTCEASVASGEMLIAGTFDVKVFNAKPQITLVQNMPDGEVSRDYTHQIKCDGSTALTPSSYTMSPTIPGLKLNTATGLITGKPTAPKRYTVTLTARNSLGFTTATDEIDIAALPQNVEGVYTGVIARNTLLNSNLGGRVDLTVVNTGALSGSVTLGTLKYSLTGVMDISQTAAPEATVTIKRTGTLGPLALKFTLDTAMNRFVTASLSDGINTAQIQGWRLIWKATGLVPNLAPSAAKLYTFALKPPAIPSALPRGDGYGSFTPAKDGKLTVAGKTGDGESFTCGTFLGPQAQVLLFGSLLSKGSLLGQLDVDFATDIVSGAVYWMRPPNSASRAYPLGYGPLDLTAVGGRFTLPTGTALVLGLTVGVDKAQLLFDAGGLNSASIDPDVFEFDILAKNAAKLPTALTPGNPGSVKITTLSPTTGLFSGTFVLEDAELRTGTAFAGKKLKRTGNFAGILTQVGGSPVGAGHFLLPELPRDANTGVTPPIPATTPSNSQILSGSVLMQKKP